MKIHHKVMGKTLHIALAGELDEHSAGYIRNTIDDLIDFNHGERVILDMSGITFMDSTGIGVILGRYKKLSAMNMPFLIASPSISADRILKMSGIYEIIPKVNYGA